MTLYSRPLALHPPPSTPALLRQPHSGRPQAPLLASCSARLLSELCTRLLPAAFGEDAPIYEAGDAAGAVFIVAQGEARWQTPLKSRSFTIVLIISLALFELKLSLFTGR